MSADLRYTRDRLSNWGAWSRDRKHYASCFSAEGRYRPERLAAGTEDERRTARRTIDVQDALAVWRAIMPARGMPMGSAMVLHGVYSHGLAGAGLRAWLHRHGMAVRGRDLEALVHSSELMAHNRLSRLDARCQGELPSIRRAL
jgi:hypothetical protein